ncbi:MAG: 30S ribosomal protein S20 [Spirochaetes bacterium GWF1_41_5]|nr:MAG: 30S ribosomal protein S20 [Spirochaetes bacterium GWF1_41_5]HBE04124.1 30S ribosomal protein S20 [Spirochaetia bacterium]
MPNIKSAEKRLRQNKKRRIYNLAAKNKIKTAHKNVVKALAGKDREKAASEFKNFVKIIDSSVSKKILHKNNAARKKSRLALLLNKMA